jgi:hypothetical protein
MFSCHWKTLIYANGYLGKAKPPFNLVANIVNIFVIAKYVIGLIIIN